MCICVYMYRYKQYKNCVTRLKVILELTDFTHGDIFRNLPLWREGRQLPHSEEGLLGRPGSTCWDPEPGVKRVYWGVRVLPAGILNLDQWGPVRLNWKPRLLTIHYLLK